MRSVFLFGLLSLSAGGAANAWLDYDRAIPIPGEVIFARGEMFAPPGGGLVQSLTPGPGLALYHSADLIGKVTYLPDRGVLAPPTEVRMSPAGRFLVAVRFPDRVDVNLVSRAGNLMWRRSFGPGSTVGGFSESGVLVNDPSVQRIVYLSAENADLRFNFINPGNFESGFLGANPDEVYFVESDGTPDMSRRDPLDGHKLWQSSAIGGRTTRSGHLYGLDPGGFWYLMSNDTGVPLRRLAPGAFVAALPNGDALVRAAGRLSRQKASTGATVWSVTDPADGSAVRLEADSRVLTADPPVAGGLTRHFRVNLLTGATTLVAEAEAGSRALSLDADGIWIQLPGGREALHFSPGSLVADATTQGRLEVPVMVPTPQHVAARIVSGHGTVTLLGYCGKVVATRYEGTERWNCELAGLAPDLGWFATPEETRVAFATTTQGATVLSSTTGEVVHELDGPLLHGLHADLSFYRLTGFHSTERINPLNGGVVGTLPGEIVEDFGNGFASILTGGQEQLVDMSGTARWTLPTGWHVVATSDTGDGFAVRTVGAPAIRMIDLGGNVRWTKLLPLFAGTFEVKKAIYHSGRLTVFVRSGGGPMADISVLAMADTDGRIAWVRRFGPIWRVGLPFEMLLDPEGDPEIAYDSAEGLATDPTRGGVIRRVVMAWETGDPYFVDRIGNPFDDPCWLTSYRMEMDGSLLMTYLSGVDGQPSTYRQPHVRRYGVF